MVLIRHTNISPIFCTFFIIKGISPLYFAHFLLLKVYLPYILHIFYYYYTYTTIPYISLPIYGKNYIKPPISHLLFAKLPGKTLYIHLYVIFQMSYSILLSDMTRYSFHLTTMQPFPKHLTRGLYLYKSLKILQKKYPVSS